MPKVIGMGGGIHDFATCLLDDKAICAIEDERITRKRYAVESTSPCKPSLDYCLNSENIKIEDIDLFVAASEDLKETHKNIKINFINHHLGHVYSAFFTSNFEDSAILILDGAGSKKFLNNPKSEARETTTYAFGNKNRIEIIGKVYGNMTGKNPITNLQSVMSNSLGEFYRVIAETLELGWLTGPGKVMGLAPYGSINQDEDFVTEIMNCVELLPEGEFMIRVNGPNGLIEKLYQSRTYQHKIRRSFEVDAAIANSAQIVFEKILIHCVKYLQTKVHSENLCLAGGVALNSIANSKVSSLTKFKNVHVFFAPGDSGTAIGAAIWGYLRFHDLEKGLVRFNCEPYLGKKYDSACVEKKLSSIGLKYFVPCNLCTSIARLLSKGKIIGWFQGKSEFGPRALGNRSILADPRNPSMRNYINRIIKEREWFRPLAPSVIDSKALTYFDAKANTPWMQFIWPVKNEFHTLLPAVTHIDGSARVQTVNKNQNPLFYELIEKFQEITGIAVLLNTSFNIKGQPIVETPEEAIRTFINSKIDVLAIDKYVVMKEN